MGEAGAVCEEPEKYPAENEDAAGQDKGNKLSEVKGDIATKGTHLPLHFHPP